MCGRYSLDDVDQFAERFAIADFAVADLQPRYRGRAT